MVGIRVYLRKFLFFIVVGICDRNFKIWRVSLMFFLLRSGCKFVLNRGFMVFYVLKFFFNEDEYFLRSFVCVLILLMLFIIFISELFFL